MSKNIKCKQLRVTVSKLTRNLEVCILEDT